MSLISFHRLLITFGILFCTGYALWELRNFVGTARPLSLVLTLLFLAAALALAYYLRHLGRLLRLDKRR